MSGSGPPLLLALALFSFLRHAVAVTSYTKGGCECVGACERTIDSPFITWCTTSPSVPESQNSTCLTASYSRSRGAYWEVCVQNTTGIQVGERVYLTTFKGMWGYMTVSAVGASAVAYCLMGCAASVLTSPKRTLLWLPLLAGFIGAGQGLLLGATLSACLSFLYLTLPYAIPVEVGVALGLAVALIASYSALGRTHGKRTFVHGSEMS